MHTIEIPVDALQDASAKLRDALDYFEQTVQLLRGEFGDLAAVDATLGNAEHDFERLARILMDLLHAAGPRLSAAATAGPEADVFAWQAVEEMSGGLQRLSDRLHQFPCLARTLQMQSAVQATVVPYTGLVAPLPFPAAPVPPAAVTGGLDPSHAPPPGGMVDMVLAIASHEVGVHEVGGNNCGQRVEEYLRCVGLGAGQPWCAAFVGWCMQHAGVHGWPMTGDTWGIRDWANQHGVYVHEPARGDVMELLDHGGNPMHTGIVAEVHADGSVSTIEGNTGMQSDTDGDGVARKTRYVAGCRFVRWPQVLLPGAHLA